MEVRRKQLWPLEEFMNNDSLVKRVADLYIHGHIAMLEEALFQIAIHCAQAKKIYTDELIHMKMGSPIFTPPENICPNSCI